MAVTINIQTNDNKLVLDINNGELTKLKEVIEKWKFKDEQCFMRFVISILLESEQNSIGIWENGNLTLVEPAIHSIKESKQ